MPILRLLSLGVILYTNNTSKPIYFPKKLWAVLYNNQSVSQWSYTALTVVLVVTQSSSWSCILCAGCCNIDDNNLYSSTFEAPPPTTVHASFHQSARAGHARRQQWQRLQSPLPGSLLVLFTSFLSLSLSLSLSGVIKVNNSRFFLFFLTASQMKRNDNIDAVFRTLTVNSAA